MYDEQIYNELQTMRMYMADAENRSSMSGHATDGHIVICLVVIVVLLAALVALSMRRQ